MATLVSDKIKLTNHWLRSDNEKIIDAKDIDWTGYSLGNQNINHSSELISYINSIGAFKLNGSQVNDIGELQVIQDISFDSSNFTLSYTYSMSPGKIVNNGGEIFNDYHYNQASGLNSHAEGTRTLAAGAHSHSEGFSNIAYAPYSHTEGCWNANYGEASHTSGKYNFTYSTAEAAFGKFNLSTYNTYIFTVGVGTSTSNRKNAMTISNEGNVNIGSLSVSNLTFSNISGEIPASPNIIELTYNELISLINASKLFPGCLYKITDYQTKVTSTGCYSNEQILTLLVMAITEDDLSPNGYIIDSDDFIYEVKYYVHNDTDKFAFVSESSKGTIYWMKDANNNEAPFDFISIKWDIDFDSNSYSVDGVYTFGNSSDNSKNMYNNIIEFGCHNININSSNNCKIGANSSNVIISSSYNVIIGDNCEQVYIDSSSYIEYEHNIKKAAVNSMVNTRLCSGKYTTFMQSFDSSIDYQTVIKPKNSVEIYV